MKDSYKALKGGILIDGNGGPPIANSVVAMKNDSIAQVGAADEIIIPEGTEVIDISGKTVMPGLIDAHLHFWGIKKLHPWDILKEGPESRAMRAVIDVWKVIDRGFTTVRDTGTASSLYLKNVIEEGSIIGPRVFAGGWVYPSNYLTYKAWPVPVDWLVERGVFPRPADGPDEIRKAVRDRLRKGYDFIKTVDDYPKEEEIGVVAEEAHNAGVKVAVHVLWGLPIKKVLNAEPDTIEHGSGLDDESIEIIIKRGIYLTPTLAILELWESKGHPWDFDEATRNFFHNTYKVHRESFDRAWKAGVKIGIGTDFLSDTMSPMGKNALELELHVKAGRSPMDVIVSATKINSEILGFDKKIGTLEVGKLADVIVVDGDPLKDISILQDRKNIIKVYKGGKEVPRLNLNEIEQT